MVKVSISELLFFIYVRDIHERKSTKKIFFKNFIPYSFYEHVKLPSAATRFSKYFLKANFETIFWEKLWPPHSYLTFTGKYPRRNVPKNLSSLVVVMASLKAIPQNHQKKTIKNTKFENLYLRMPSSPHRFFGCNCKYLGLSPWTTFHFHVAPQTSSRNWVAMWQKIAS